MVATLAEAHAFNEALERHNIAKGSKLPVDPDAQIYAYSGTPGAKSPVITKRTRFGRITRARYDEDTDRIHYLHATKGWRSRRYSPQLFAELISGR